MLTARRSDAGTSRRPSASASDDDIGGNPSCDRDGERIELIEFVARRALPVFPPLEEGVGKHRRDRARFVETGDLPCRELHLRCPRLSSSCWIVRGPMIGSAPLPATQAIATWLGDASVSSATVSTVSRIAVRCALFSGWNTRPPRAAARPVSPRRSLPVSMPPPSGDQATIPRPSACPIGSRSCSGVRSTRLCSTCSPAIGAEPRSSAIVAARATRQAGKSESPA